jgi:haloacetate dehalogenase
VRTRLFDRFKSEDIVVESGVRIHACIGGSGPALLLLHGFPQTHFCWHKIAPKLAERFTVVATDLRGYGASSKVDGGHNHINYSKRAMALDQVRVMQALGFKRFHLAGHDRGGRVAHRLALDHPNSVTRLAILDIAPTSTMYARTDRAFAEAYYHWFFLIQPFDLPERLIGSDADYFLRQTLKSWCKRDGAISEAAIATYAEAFNASGAIHAACEDYRAAATVDLEHDRADDEIFRRVAVPMLVLWGGRGTVGRQFDVLSCWREKSDATVDGKVIDCGHFLPEEAPGETLAEFQRFFSQPD